jgi:carbon-monoxide dehydrogenase small subunit
MNGVASLGIAFTLNGKAAAATVEPRELLIDVLRERFGLTGAKRSCDVEVCGACTVLVDGLPASSCTTLAADVDGRDVLTIEGLAGDGRLDRVQRAFVEHGAMQCGFCTPGMVLAVKALLAIDPHPSEAAIRHFLRGNLCRCTGYVKIIEAVMDLAGHHDADQPRD